MRYKQGELLQMVAPCGHMTVRRHQLATFRTCDISRWLTSRLGDQLYLMSNNMYFAIMADFI